MSSPKTKDEPVTEEKTWETLPQEASEETQKTSPKKGFFRRISLRRKSKTNDEKNQPALKLEDEDIDRDSAINPFADDTEETQPSGDQAQAEVDEAPDSDDDDHQQEDEEQEAGDQQTEGGKKSKFSIRNGLKARRERKQQKKATKIHKKADKLVDKAMAKAEAERLKWLAQVKEEEEEEEEERRERQLAWMKKAASRSKDLMLQHLCATSIQAAWRSRIVRHRLQTEEEYHEGNIEESATSAEATEVAGFTESPSSVAENAATESEARAPMKAPTLIASSIIDMVETQGVMSP